MDMRSFRLNAHYYYNHIQSFVIFNRIILYGHTCTVYTYTHTYTHVTHTHTRTHARAHAHIKVGIPTTEVVAVFLLH